MKEIFDTVSQKCSFEVTQNYSTSFSIATKLLGASIRQDIHNIYGFVRFADEIVDTFHAYEKERLFNKFETDLYEAIEEKISLNPVLNSFQMTVHKYKIPEELYRDFLKSMRADLHKSVYNSVEEYQEYIYGSADVVGLMCLMVFVKGDKQKYDDLKYEAMKLGSAFQKVNFLRDIKADYQELDRTYFPGASYEKMDETIKNKIIQEIEEDFAIAYHGIKKLPNEARLGVFTAYFYYRKLLQKLKKTSACQLMNTRISVPNYQKAAILAKTYVGYKLNHY
ncbi:phytoene/squalene synthase family protein [Mesonia sp. K7]|uniref:phytoene/squalene synthase family protein n=1 Tax=Mesonia sp. K7 TaxID=2218606 RepID=UPI000DA77915|nr:phytoene/squalene synthase family protein [Mesonia sp. K7]PZD77871.1 phytoene/squalene synthase family protein [Mesonia sp. K7]